MRSALVVRALVVVTLTLLASSAGAAARKVAVTGMVAGAGVDGKVAAAVTESVAGALAKTGVDVVTEAQLKALLDLEAQKQLAGCSGNDSCIAQIGEALGADAVVTGSLAVVGKSWLVSLRSVEVKTGKGTLADRRLKGGSLDDVLDALPALVSELQVSAPPPAGAPTAAPAAAATAPAAASTGPVPLAKGPRPASTADVPYILDAETRARMRLATVDGVAIAWDPKPKDSFAPFFAGFVGSKHDELKLYAQRVSGGGRQGDTQFDVVFWEPRVKARWQAGFGVKDGKPWLQCGDQKLDLTLAAPTAAKKLTFLDVRWQRRLVAVARGDDGVWYVVDQARLPEGNRDYRLHIGKSGGPFSTWPVTEAVVAGAEQLFLTDAGQLDASGGKFGERAVRVLDVEDAAGEVYGRLGVYSEPLGTACDRWLGSAK